MTETWDEARLKQYITDSIEESLNLDYKAAASLSRDDKKKMEITKDVSAMANSDGGLIIYGISEFQDTARRHLPEKLDPIDRTKISKEWLEQVISNIRPKIDGLKIYPISRSSGANDVAYVVDIPQSHTAHQATDKRYYKRFNFESVAMEDYEIRDVMGRKVYPKLELTFQFKKQYYSIGNSPDRHESHVILHVTLKNVGKSYAEYFVVYINLPHQTLYKQITNLGASTTRINGNLADQIQWDNIDRTNNLFRPLLPSLSTERYIYLNLDILEKFDSSIEWAIFADNLPEKSGIIAISKIQVVE